MKRARLQHFVARSFLSVGYLSGALGWFWVLLVLVPSLIKNGSLESFVASPSPAEPIVTTPPIETSPLAWAVIGIVTLVILLVTIVILVRIPRGIVHTGERIVNQTAQAVIPVISHHKPLPVKRQRILSRRIMLGLQLGLSVLPLFISLFLPAYDELSTDIIKVVAACLAVVATASFTVAWVLEPKTAISRTRSRASRG